MLRAPLWPLLAMQGVPGRDDDPTRPRPVPIPVAAPRDATALPVAGVPPVARNDFLSALAQQAPPRSVGVATGGSLPLPRGRTPEMNPVRPLENMLRFVHEYGPTGQLEQAGRAGYALGRAVQEHDLAKGLGALTAGALVAAPESQAAQKVVGKVLGKAAGEAASEVEQLNPFRDLPEPPRVFHGTRTHFDSFDMGKLGSATGSPSAKEAIFFARSPETADAYAHLRPDDEAYHLDDLYRQADEADLLAADAEDIGMPESARRKRSEAEQLRQQIADIEARAPMIRPARIAMRNPLVIDYGGREFRDESFYDAIIRAKENGHDGVIFRNTVDGGPVDDVHAVFSRAQVRSPWGDWKTAAQFGALAGVLAGGASAARPASRSSTSH